MSLRALALAFVAAFARPLDPKRARSFEAITRPERERGRFHGAMQGAIKSERGLGKALHLLSGLSRIGGRG